MTEIRHSLGSVVLSALVIVPCSVGAQPAPDATALARADQLAAEGRWHEASSAYHALASPTEEPALWYRLGVALALEGDASGAADAFRRVGELDPGFPDIAARLGAAESRAAFDEEQALDPPGFFEDPTVRLATRRAALDRRDLLDASRAAVDLEAGFGPEADAVEFAARGEGASAAEAALEAVAASPGAPAPYLNAADALSRVGELAAARYYLSLYYDLGGDPVPAAPVLRLIERADAPGRVNP